LKNLLITGALGGLGSPLTDYFSSTGYQVFGTTSPSKTTVNRNNTKYYPLNLTDENAAQELIDQLKSEKIKLKAAILTVGGFAMNNLSNAKLSDYEHMIKLNFFTAINVIKPVHKWMCELGGGDIFMIGSRPLFEGSSREILPYTLSKSLLLQLTHSLNESSAEDKVFTSLIVPGTIDTPINRQQMPAADFTQWTQPLDIAHEIHQLMEQKDITLKKSVVKLY
jgi:short-subunit dehydrogenase